MTIETADMLNQEQGVTAPGTILALRRKELGWTESDVANKLCLLPKQVQDLENNDFDAFAVEIFAKGYLRSYARLVSIDEAGLLSLYEQHYQKAPLAEPSMAKPIADLPAQRPAARRYLAVAAVLLVALVLWFFSDKEQGVATNGEASSSVAGTVLGVADSGADASLATLASNDLSDDLSQLEQHAEPFDVSKAETVITNDSPAPLTIVEIDDEASPATDTASETNALLQLSFSGDCWVEVRDATGSVLIANLKRADDILNLSGIAPFRVLLGNATVVSVSYNGEPVNVNPSADNQSARITIGS